MYKMFLTLAVFIGVLTVVTAQEKTSNPTAKTDYSESTPYEPREVNFVEPKTRKEKKPKKDSDEKKPLQADDEISPKQISGNKTIRIPVFVYDQTGKPVTGLQNPDIKVFVDDKEQEISTFESSKTALNILLVLDSSPSTAYKDDDLKKVVSEMVKALKPDDKLQIIKFNQEFVVLTEPANDAKIFQKALKKIQMGDGTSLYDTIRTINREHLSSTAEPPVIILLTDGVDTTSKMANYITSLVEAEQMGAVVFPFYIDTYNEMLTRARFPIVGFGINRPQMIGASKAEYEIGRAYLQDIAALSGGKTFVLKNLSGTKKEDFEAAFKFINPQYYISVTSAETASDFQRKKIKVRVNRPNLIVRARGSFIAQ